MKNYLLLLFGALILIYSCVTHEKIQIESSYPPDSIKVDKTLFVFNDKDSIRIESDSIFVKTKKVVKDVDSMKTKPSVISQIDFVGNADIQQAISSQSELPANAGLGVRLTKEYGQPTSWLRIDHLDLDLSITIASTVDTIIAVTDSIGNVTNQKDFGHSVLLPVNSGQSVSLNMKTYINFPNPKNLVFLENFGLEGYLVASNRIWEVEGNTEDIATLATYIGVFTDIIPRARKNEFSVSLGIGPSIRVIFGDIGHLSDVDLRNQVLGTSERCYYGIEPKISIRLRDVKAVASIPILWKRSGPDVPGLTKGQFVTTIRFTGGFPLRINTR